MKYRYWAVIVLMLVTVVLGAPEKRLVRQMTREEVIPILSGIFEQLGVDREIAEYDPIYGYSIPPDYNEFIVGFLASSVDGAVALVRRDGDRFFVVNDLVDEFEGAGWIIDMRVFVNDLGRFLTTTQSSRGGSNCGGRRLWRLFRIDNEDFHDLNEMLLNQYCRPGLAFDYARHDSITFLTIDEENAAFEYEHHFTFYTKDTGDTLISRAVRKRFQYYPEIDTVAEFLAVATNDVPDRKRNEIVFFKGDTLGVSLGTWGFLSENYVTLFLFDIRLEVSFSRFKEYIGFEYLDVIRPVHRKSKP